MASRYAVVVVVDGLRADALGCYGNAGAETPFLDRLAAESVVFDFAFCLDPTVEGFYWSALLGVHPAYRHAGTHADKPRQEHSCVAAASHFLVTDEPAVAALDVRPHVWSGFHTFTPDISGSVQSASEGRRFVQSAAAWLNDRFISEDTRPVVAWVHTSLLTRRPPLVEHAENGLLSRRPYDEAVTAIDAAIGTLFTELSFSDNASDIRFIVVGARGLSLGERDGGGGLDILHEELLHIPLVVHSVQDCTDPFRTPQLTSPLDVHAILSCWSAENVDDLPRADWLFFATNAGESALRTPGWYLLQPSLVASNAADHEAHADRLQLYLKPDDRWEQNEIHSRCLEVASKLSERLTTLQSQAAAGMPLTLPRLPAELLKGG